MLVMRYKQIAFYDTASARDLLPDCILITMKLRLVLAALLALSSFAKSQATLWSGTITETVTSTNNPNYNVGDVVLGLYEYESDTVDGDFGTGIYAAFNPGSIGTLHTTLYNFAPQGNNGWITPNNETFAFLHHMVVTNGVVTDFYRTGQIGASDFDFGVNSFDSTLLGEIKTSGTLVFSAPSSTVPDSTASLGLLGIGMLSVTMVRRRLVCPKPHRSLL